MNKNIIISGLLVVAFAAGGFFGGMKYQQSKIGTNFRRQFGDNLGQREVNGQVQGQTRMGGRQTIGEIGSLDDKSITVKMQDGSSKIVILSDTTKYVKASSATKGDFKVGDTVAVFGTTNSDGSLTAENVQLNPTMLRSNDNQQPNQQSSQPQ
ncbi:hypothetical protein COT51_01320 [candidate division WWE3 bacterium CG08_land_8_20_14_0_20_41_15]|uniref:DUF5666 domain-containing protein n=1 Tax=candidate division WWE3 bacterium CG08_land_8_20_14_0_20_41_15 TaxID=1975086 RepID=A0A2H0XA08_UNCKA|nr:MAG: hypothetical protein COT51_01320 [candidate division WWE3 bacterium CG08_land_8_20_14_0_20_41_15]